MQPVPYYDEAKKVLCGTHVKWEHHKPTFFTFMTVSELNWLVFLIYVTTLCLLFYLGFALRNTWVIVIRQGMYTVLMLPLFYALAMLDASAQIYKYFWYLQTILHPNVLVELAGPVFKAMLGFEQVYTMCELSYKLHRSMKRPASTHAPALLTAQQRAQRAEELAREERCIRRARIAACAAILVLTLACFAYLAVEEKVMHGEGPIAKQESMGAVFKKF